MVDGEAGGAPGCVVTDAVADQRSRATGRARPAASSPQARTTADHHHVGGDRAGQHRRLGQRTEDPRPPVRPVGPGPEADGATIRRQPSPGALPLGSRRRHARSIQIVFSSVYWWWAWRLLSCRRSRRRSHRRGGHAALAAGADGDGAGRIDRRQVGGTQVGGEHRRGEPVAGVVGDGDRLLGLGRSRSPADWLEDLLGGQGRGPTPSKIVGSTNNPAVGEDPVAAEGAGGAVGDRTRSRREPCRGARPRPSPRCVWPGRAGRRPPSLALLLDQASSRRPVAVHDQAAVHEQFWPPFQ